MSDIASLGLKIDSTQVVAGKTALDRFAESSKKAATGASAISNASKTMAKSGELARHEMINLSRQVQDVGVSLASGQSPFLIMVQQGTQIADVFAASKTGSVGGAIKQAARGIAGFLTPVRLLGGAVAAAGFSAYASYQSWKSWALQLDEAARAANTTTREMATLQAASSFKGIGGDEFADGMMKFSQQIYLSNHGLGEMANLFRANGTQAKGFSQSLETVADLIKNASSDQQRLIILQQVGLPATIQWVRFLSQGAEGIRKAKAEAESFGHIADDEMIAKARQFDEAWSKTISNWGTAWRSAAITAAGWVDWLAEKGNSGLMKLGVNVGANLMRGGYGTPMSSDVNQMYGGTIPESRSGGANKQTVDPAILQRQISLEQQRIGILGQTASVEQQVRAVELQIQQARLSGANITAAEAENVKRLATENALGITQIKAATDATRLEAETIGMSVGQASAYAAAQNAINEARRAGRTLTPGNIAAIRAEASALGEAAQHADNMRWGYENLIRGPLQTFRSTLQDTRNAWDALKAAGMSALESISTKLMDMAAQNLFKAAFGGSSGSGFSSFLGSLFGTATHHTGYGPGDPITQKRMVHPAYFDNAPRFHSGIGPGERAAVIRNDESVLTPGQMKQLAPAGAAPSVTIVQNNTFNGADPGSEARLRAALSKTKDQAVAEAVNQVSRIHGTSPQYLRNSR